VSLQLLGQKAVMDNSPEIFVFAVTWTKDNV